MYLKKKNKTTIYGYYQSSMSGDSFFLHLYCVSVPNIMLILFWLRGITKLHSKQMRKKRFSFATQGELCSRQTPGVAPHTNALIWQ